MLASVSGQGLASIRDSRAVAARAQRERDAGGFRVAKKREGGLLDVLAELPWWISVCFGAVVYVVLQFVIPAITFTNPILKAMAPAAPQLSWTAVIFLAPAAVSGFRELRDRMRGGGSPSVGGVSVRVCPSCGGGMVLREAKRGSHAGNKFWGCSNYPKCRRVEQIGQ
jgi:hypothetical protein